MVADRGDLPPAVPHELLARASAWPSLKRWERREVGIQLRALGLSYREIGAIIPVGRGTLSACRDIDLTDEQRARLAMKRPAVAVRREVGARRRAQSLERVQHIRAAARAEAALLVKDPFWVAGVVAYWAEGAKTSNELLFSNSDPPMVNLFIRWASRFLGLEVDRFTAKLHLHSGQDESERVGYWSNCTGIPIGRFGKTFIKGEGSGHRKNVLWGGTMTVRVTCSTDLFHRVKGWISGLSDLVQTDTLAQPGR